ncbi:hypothetical protein ACKFKF_30790 [Phormidesmis sp. 146-12]
MTDTPDQPANLSDRVQSLEVDMLDVKISLNRLIDAFYQNNQNVTNAIERMSEVQIQTMTVITEIQSEVRGLQTENRRILEILSRDRE